MLGNEDIVIAVDLTPVLPGGENGGAKVFALELVRHLAASSPRTRFVLLTQAATHEELAALDRDNVRRELVLGAAAASLRSRIFRRATRVLATVPAWARRRLAHVGYRLHGLLKRRSSLGLLRRIGADLLFCPFTAPTFREPGIPTVCTIYDLQFEAYPQFFALEDVVQRERAFGDACRHATALAAISDFSRDSAIAAGPVEPGRITTIRLRLPLEVGCAPRPPRDRCEGVDPLFVYPANFWRHKNHEMLLTAFAMACRGGLAPEVKLVCTGAPGDRQEWLARAARALGLGERVLFPGFVPREELETLMRRSCGVLFPSLYEGFGLPVIEAMAAGVPVACSNVTSLPEVAGDAALFFDPRLPADIARAILSLANDEGLRRGLIQAGRRRAAQFGDPGRMVAEYGNLFERALASKLSRVAA